MKRRIIGVMGNKKTLLFALLPTIGIIGALFGTPIVHAFTDYMPGGLDVEAANDQRAIELHLKNLDAAEVEQNKIGAYYPGWDATSNGKSIQITDGIRGRVCNIQNNITGRLYVDVETQGGTTRIGDINVQNLCTGGAFYNHTFTFPNGYLMYDGNINMYFARITISYITNRPAGATRSDLNYKMHTTGVNGTIARLALTKNNSAKQFGMRSSYADDPSAANGRNSLRIAIPYGYHCSLLDLSDDESRTVRLYDADAVFGDTYMWVTRDGGRLPQSAYVNLNRMGTWIAAENRWLVSGSNDDQNSATIRISEIVRGARYELNIVNTGRNDYGNPGPSYNARSVHQNTLSVGIPQDGIYGKDDLDCGYQLRPQMLSVPANYVYYPNFDVGANIVKTGAGPVPESHAWQVFGVRYPGAPAATDLTDTATADDPCTQVIPAGGSGCAPIANLGYGAQPGYNGLYNQGGPDGVGTRLCFFARIQNPTESVNDDDLWRYSDMVCSVSSKKPRTQFLGSDLRIGGEAISPYYDVQGTYYGSWAEYAVLTQFNNFQVSSGNSLREGNANPATEWNKLTFANSGSGMPSGYGGYNPVPSPSGAHNYFGSMGPSGGGLNPANPATGVYVLASGSCVPAMTVPTGRSVIIRTTDPNSGTLRVCGSGNVINVPNNGATNANSLGQVVLVANTILIDEGVTNVDAWLVTPYASGTVDTCYRGGDPNLNGSVCAGTLNVNGPVITRTLKLRRTAGANAVPADQLKAPAERFNLRPDAQLWAYAYANKGDFAQTDYMQELPPRY